MGKGSQLIFCGCPSACTNSVAAQPCGCVFCFWLVVTQQICNICWMVSSELAGGSCSTLLAGGWFNGPRVCGWCSHVLWEGRVVAC